MARVKIIPSKSFLKVLDELRSVPGAPSNIKKLPDSDYSLTTSDIRWCHDKIKERGLPHRIHELLNESQIVLPKYEPPPRSPELEKRIAALKAEQANREYRRMTKHLVVDQYEASSLKGLGTDLKDLKVQIREINRHLVTGLQYIVSIVGTFFAIFVGLSYVLGDYGTRLLLSIFCAVLVGLAEMYFIIKQDMEEEERQAKKIS